MATLRKYVTTFELPFYLLKISEVDLTDEQLAIFKEDEDRFYDEVMEDLEFEWVHDKAGFEWVHDKAGSENYEFELVELQK